MSTGEDTGFYVFCKICGRNVSLNIDEDEIKNSSRGTSAVMCLHGEPQHAILVYIDKTLRVRGAEYPSALQIEQVSQQPDYEDGQTTRAAEVADFDMGTFVEAFGKNRKKGIEMVADLILQVLLSHPVYLVHTKESIGMPIKKAMSSLFVQETLIHFLRPEQRSAIKGPKESVFDLDSKHLFVLGSKIDAHFFRQLINQCIDDADSFYRLRNELSKILYSFSQMMEILTKDSRSYTDTMLAREISIELPLMPILLKMAESNGVRVNDRIQHDGFGSALRSI